MVLKNIPPSNRILVVDDEDHILTLFRDILGNTPAPVKVAGQESNYEVVLMDRGQKGIDAVRESLESGTPFAMAFLDIHMPDMDGLETARRIRELDPRIYIVIVTGGQDSRLDQLSPDIKEHLVLFRKPFSLDEVIQLAFNFCISWQRDAQLEQNRQQLLEEVTLRRQAEESLKSRLKIEATESRVSQLLGSRHSADLREVLKVTAMGVEGNRAFLFRLRDAGKTMDAAYEWCAMGIKSFKTAMQDITTSHFSWWMRQLEENEEIVINSVEDYPRDAAVERATMKRLGIVRLLTVPIQTGSGELLAFLGVSSDRDREPWDRDDKRALRKVAEIINIYWDRLETEQTLLEIEEKYRKLQTQDRS